MKNYKISDFFQTKIQLPNRELSQKFYDMVVELGFQRVRGTENSAIESGTFFLDSNRRISFSSLKKLDGWGLYYKVLDWREIFEDEVTGQENLKTKFDNCKIWIENSVQLYQVIERIKVLDYNSRDLCSYDLPFGLAFCSDRDITHHGEKFDKEANDFKKVSLEEFLGYETKIINKNSNNLKTRINGKSIIVPTTVATITNGKRPEGTSVSGKTSKTTIRSGHLNHRRIDY